MPYHKRGAYDAFDSVAEAKQHYRRCRTRKDFILSDQGVASDSSLTCHHCKGKLSEPPADKPDTPQGYRGNRCTYHPKVKRVACFHYVCAWQQTLKQISDLSDLF